MTRFWFFGYKSRTKPKKLKIFAFPECLHMSWPGTRGISKSLENFGDQIPCLTPTRRLKIHLTDVIQGTQRKCPHPLWVYHANFFFIHKSHWDIYILWKSSILRHAQGGVNCPQSLGFLLRNAKIWRMVSWFHQGSNPWPPSLKATP